MKKLFATCLAVVLGCVCLGGNAASVRGAAYCDDGIMPLAISNGVTVNYETKTVDTFRMVVSHPEYMSAPYASACACIAGANVIGYFDRYDEDLIPDHQAGTEFRGQYLYSIEDSNVMEVVKQLYADMGTSDRGTTVTGFLNGMRTFCARKGKNISFSSCMKNGRFDYSAAKSYMQSDMPVVLFCAGYNMAEIDLYDFRDLIHYYEIAENHVMVGFGYQEITYTLSTTTGVYEYVKVASGVNSKPSGYYDTNYKTNVDDAYAINIY